MPRTVQIIWWIGLIGALIPTTIILKQAVLVLRVLRDILRLARHSADAARGIATNVSAISRLGDLRAGVGAVPAGAHVVATLAGSIDQKLQAADVGDGH